MSQAPSPKQMTGPNASQVRYSTDSAHMVAVNKSAGRLTCQAHASLVSMSLLCPLLCPSVSASIAGSIRHKDTNRTCATL